MNPLIELRDIRKTYVMGKTSVKALDGVSLTIEAGEFVAIMGASGSGKSTLLSIVGLLDRPTSGSYRLMGEPVERYSDDELSVIRNRVAGFVFQQFYLLPKMTALENAELPLVYAGRREMKAHVQAVLDDVGIGPRSHHYPNEMSGGEQQRVAI
ncbi:MAG: ATP-binding cassette domain-containing protein, partial [Spirochaetes bacterium]|nr:ATP-binding cassette domain-containing protein [Spirochaetota bacterium]